MTIADEAYLEDLDDSSSLSSESDEEMRSGLASGLLEPPSAEDQEQMRQFEDQARLSPRDISPPYPFSSENSEFSEADCDDLSDFDSSMDSEDDEEYRRIFVKGLDNEYDAMKRKGGRNLTYDHELELDANPSSIFASYTERHIFGSSNKSKRPLSGSTNFDDQHPRPRRMTLLSDRCRPSW